MVPAAAFAADQPADEAANEGVELQTADGAKAFTNGAVTAGAITIDGAYVRDWTGTADSFTANNKAKALVPTEVTTDDGNRVAIATVDKTNKTVSVKDGFTVEYFKAGTDGKATGSAIDAPSDPGKYVVVVTAGAKAGVWDGGSVSAAFEIAPAALGTVSVYEVNPAKDTDVSDTTFTYTGSTLNVGVKTSSSALEEGKDYEVKFLKAGDSIDDPSVEVKDAGSYYAVVTGKGMYSGQKAVTQNFTVKPFDLSEATITTDDVVNSNVKPSAPNSVVNATDADHPTALDPSLVKLTLGSGVFGEPGEYNFAAAPATEQSETNPNITGEGVSKVNKVQGTATFKYDNAAFPTTFSTDLSKSDAQFDLSKIAVYKNATDKTALTADTDYAVTVTDKAGKDVTKDFASSKKIDKAGTYTVTVKVKSDSTNVKYAVGGSVTATVTVVNAAVDLDATAYVSYKGETVTSIDATYTGSNILSDVKYVVKDADGTDRTSDVTVKYTNAKGETVKTITDAGTYTMTITSDKLDVKGTNTVAINVAKVDLSKLKLSGLDKSGSGFEYVDLEKASAALPTVDYYTGEKDSDGKDVTAAVSNLKSGDVTVTYKKLNAETGEYEKVASLNGAGTYTVTVAPATDKVANNYAFAGEDGTTATFYAQKKSDMVFDDVTPDAWYFNEVNAAHSAEYIYGVNNSTKQFAPNTDITRADVAVILGRMAGVPTDPNKEGYESFLGGYTTPFSDVQSGAYYAKAIAWAAKTGIVTGYGDGTFKPEQKITREEFATMLARYAEKVKGADITADDSVLADYADAANVSDWAKGYVAWAVEAKAMGQNTDMLSAGLNISRAEVAAMAVRYQPAE